MTPYLLFVIPACLALALKKIAGLLLALPYLVYLGFGLLGLMFMGTGRFYSAVAAGRKRLLAQIPRPAPAEVGFPELVLPSIERPGSPFVGGVIFQSLPFFPLSEGIIDGLAHIYVSFKKKATLSGIDKLSGRVKFLRKRTTPEEEGKVP